MNKIGLRFLLKQGQFLNVEVPLKRADQILSRWLLDHASYKISNVDDNDGSGVLWIVSSQDIQAIHTFDLESVPVPAPSVSGSFVPCGADPVWTPDTTPNLNWRPR